ncbi:hypothetical protein V8C26DRAFT_252297 [Trichoderma gracile]
MRGSLGEVDPFGEHTTQCLLAAVGTLAKDQARRQSHPTATGEDGRPTEGNGVHTKPSVCFCQPTSHGVIRLCLLHHHPSNSLRHVVPGSCAPSSLPELFYPRDLAVGRPPSDGHRIGVA